MEELRVQVLGRVESFQMLFVVLELTEGQTLLIVDLLVARAHVLHDRDLGRNLTLRRPSLG